MPGSELLFPDVGFDGISIAVTTRQEMGSRPPVGTFGRFNLASHVGDDPQRVAANRELLSDRLNLAARPIWLEQVHGNEVVVVSSPLKQVPTADASVTTQPKLPLAILTADCLPIVIWDESHRQVAALHAGWRGLANGIIERVMGHFQSRSVLVWIGPGIGPCHYEVDAAVRENFSSPEAFKNSRPGHYRFDLVAEARRQFRRLGVSHIQDMQVCTACDERFYSYRRDGQTGRFATLAWL
jgi:YfiH family protein